MNLEKNVRTPSDQVAAMSQHWPMIAALMGGSGAMRAAGKTLLPQWPNEDSESYDQRLKVATLHPVFRRTVLVNAARPFSKPPTVEAEGIPPEWLEDVDLQGTSLPAFANALLADALAFGLCGLLTEYPQAKDVRTRADEQRAGVRPYFVRYKPTDILGWRVAGMKLAQLRLLERVEVEDGQWATQTIEQVRVLTPGAWQVYRQSERDKNQWDLFDEGVTTLKEIPFEFIYGLRCGFGHGLSPLLDLAFQNVEHYQASSDQQTILHVARVPILVAVGFGDSQITIGASHAVTSDNTDAKLEYVEHTGAAIDAGRQALLDLEERMRATGAELISQQQTQTTATQINAEGESAKSTLQQVVEQFEESLEAGIRFMALWVGKDAKPEVELFKSYESASAGDAQVLAGAVAVGALSKETMFEELQRRDVLSLDRTWEDEKARIDGEAPTEDPNKPEPGKPNPAQQ